MSYDANGNILGLQRNRDQRGLSGITVTSTPQTIDNLSYTYTSGNQLSKVEDASAVIAGFKNGVNTSTEYTYAADGSLTKDDNKGISTITYNILGKPQQITFTDGRVIVYTYSADGNKLKMSVTQSGTTTHTDYSGSFVYENSALSFFGAPEGRVVKNGSNYEYQYALGDHQGNTRVVFSSAPAPVQSATATFEVSAQSNEATKFQNYPSTSGINPVSSNNSTPGGTSSQYLHGGLNSQVGVAKSFKVFPGDQVKIEAYARYTEGSGPGNLENFATALLAAFNLAPPGGGETGTASSAINTWGTVEAGGYAHGLSNTDPKAFVNIILFDQNYNFIDAGYMQVTSSGSPAYISKSYTVKEAGYAYLYISNENATIVDVYFDDVTMSYTPGNVVQYNEYYPFGLQTVNSWTRENTAGNNFLGNGGTELNKTSSLYDLSFRNYDPVLGRMNGVDPVAGKYSSLTPYNFSFNDPVTFNDVSGAEPDIYDYNRVHFSGGSIGDLMDPGLGSYGTAGAGLNPYYSVLNLVQGYNPDIRGTVYLGNGISGLPTEIARAGGPESYYNTMSAYNMGMTAFNSVQNPLTWSQGYSGYFPVENGGIDWDNSKVYTWGLVPNSTDIMARNDGVNGEPCPKCPRSSRGPSLTDVLLGGVGTAGLVAQIQAGVIMNSRSGFTSGKVSPSSPRVYSKTTAGKINLTAKGVGWGLTIWSVYNTETQFRKGEIDASRRRYNNLNSGVGVFVPQFGIPMAAGDYLGQKYSNEIVTDVSQPGGFLFEGTKYVFEFLGIPTSPDKK